jgi:hypothetical protein
VKRKCCVGNFHNFPCLLVVCYDVEALGAVNSGQTGALMAGTGQLELQENSFLFR